MEELYMPAACIIRAKENEKAEEHPTDSNDTQSNEERGQSFGLLLPSAIGHTTPCDVRLREIEWQIRHARVNDALEELWHALRMRSYLNIDKHRFQRGQRQNTRSRTIIQRTEVKVNNTALKYRTARSALQNLDQVLKKHEWDVGLPPLLPEDTRGMIVGRAGQSGGGRELSWIWTTFGASSTEQGDERPL